MLQNDSNHLKISLKHQKTLQILQETFRTPQNTWEHLKKPQNILERQRNVQHSWETFQKGSELIRMPQNASENLETPQNVREWLKSLWNLSGLFRTHYNASELPKMSKDTSQLFGKFWKTSEPMILSQNTPERQRTPYNLQNRFRMVEKHKNSSEHPRTSVNASRCTGILQNAWENFSEHPTESNNTAEPLATFRTNKNALHHSRSSENALSVQKPNFNPCEWFRTNQNTP